MVHEYCIITIDEEDGDAFSSIHYTEGLEAGMHGKLAAAAELLKAAAHFTPLPIFHRRVGNNRPELGA